MPYETINDLPENVKALSKEEQEKWLETYRSVFSATNSEKRAFAAAWAAVNEDAEDVEDEPAEVEEKGGSDSTTPKWVTAEDLQKLQTELRQELTDLSKQLSNLLSAGAAGPAKPLEVQAAPPQNQPPAEKKRKKLLLKKARH